MSYTGFGIHPPFGLGQEIPTQQVGALLADAYKSVVTSDTPLSPISQIFVTVAKNGIESTTGIPLPQIAQSIINAIPDTIMNLMTSTIGDISVAIPVVNVAIEFITAGINISKSLADADRAQAAAYCKDMLESMAPVPSGGFFDCRPCPSDIFGQYFGSKDQPRMSILGSLLVRMTEANTGGIPTSESAQWAAGKVFEDWYKQIVQYTNNLRKLGVFPEPRPLPLLSGIPRARRELFAKVRRAIGATRTAGAITDGGQGLWAIYMDMLLREFDEGHMNWDLAANLMANPTVFPDSDGRMHVNVDTPSWDCEGRAYINSIKKLVDAWRATVIPTIIQGKRKLDEIRAALPKIDALSKSRISIRIPALMNVLAPAPSLPLRISPTIAKALATRLAAPAPAKKISPPAAIGLGAGAAGLIWLLFA